MSEDGSTARAEALVDHRLMNAYAESVKALGSPDLVLVLDETKQDFQSYERSKFAADYRAFLGAQAKDDSLLERVQRSSASTMQVLKTSLAFWFVVFFSDGEVACIPVGGQRQQQGSSVLS